MKRIALFESSGKTEAISWAEYTAVKLKELGAECFATPELISSFSIETDDIVQAKTVKEFEKYADLAISFGGDGTMLSAVRQLINTDLPLMGVNVGKLGFLAEFSTENLDQTLIGLMKGEYRVVDRSVLETVINNEKIFALNDFVIEKKDSSHMIVVQAYANDHYIGDYRADGVILSTPTGSTAYSLSCGGPIIAPSTSVLCMTPISPHSLTVRPLIIADSNEIAMKIYAHSGEANLVADGQIKRVLQNNEKVIFTKSEAKAKLIKPLDTTYYDLLRRKLLWAANAIDHSRDIKK